MAVGLDHPVVADYLRRLDAAAAGLPAGRRTELVAEIQGHVAEALASAGRDDEATVRGVLDRLGEPEDIVTAELEAEGAVPTAALPGGSGPGGSGPGGSGPPAYWSPSWPAGYPGPQAAYPGQPVGHLGQGAGVWGPVEIIAVLGLTVGAFVLPGIGPIVGLVCAWISDRWTRREKVVATIWTLAVAVAMVVFGVSLFAAQSSQTGGPVPAPVVSAVQAPVATGSAP